MALPKGLTGLLNTAYESLSDDCQHDMWCLLARHTWFERRYEEDTYDVCDINDIKKYEYIIVIVVLTRHSVQSNATFISSQDAGCASLSYKSKESIKLSYVEPVHPS